MKKTTIVRKTKSTVTSPNLEFGQKDAPITTKSSIRKTSNNNKIRANKNYIKNSKKTNLSNPEGKKGILISLLVITFTAFSFGGLGFGYTLRYAQKWQKIVLKSSTLQNNFVKNPPVISQDSSPENTLDLSFPNGFN
jgi:hypothetical protein